MGVMHLSLSVRGALNQSDRELKPWCGNITVDGKKLMSVREIRAFLIPGQTIRGYGLLSLSGARSQKGARYESSFCAGYARRWFVERKIYGL